jgi:hypothetical protein
MRDSDSERKTQKFLHNFYTDVLMSIYANKISVLKYVNLPIWESERAEIAARLRLT